MTRDDTVEPGLIEEKTLANRMRLRLYDRSRRLAADRWLVKLHGEARIPLQPELLAGIGEGDPKLLEAMRQGLGDELAFTLERERNFVAEEEKEEVLAELHARVSDHLLAYLASPAFPQKLFRRRCEELKARLLIEREQARCAPADDEEEEEDEGPADFSACFRDRAP